MSQEDPEKALRNPELYGGDILGINPNDFFNAIPNDNQRWPNNTIPYVIDATLGKLFKYLNEYQIYKLLLC